MGTEERTSPDDHLEKIGRVDSGHAATSCAVEKWLRNIRARIPAGAVLSATVRSKAHHGYFASFRLNCEGEAISSEARAETVEEAVRKAGEGLCQHLPSGELDEGEEDFYLAG